MSSSFDKYVTIFSHEGKLFQVEYAFKASCNFSNCIAIKGSDTVCAIIEKKNMHTINQSKLKTFCTKNDIGYVCKGIPSDAYMFIDYITEEISNYFSKFRQNIPIEYLVKKISEKKQINTQYAFTRPWGVKSIVIGVKENGSPSLYKIDPSGYATSHMICAIGEHENEVNNYISRKIKYYSIIRSSQLETVISLILLFQRILKYDINATNVEIMISTSRKRKVKILKNFEIDFYLNYLENF
ncbi:26S proteasome IOTA SU (nucleomorph) [Cryptomonas paramecium]|uniref:26S proteasome IOTA SU n=1 Tax=Cryptomonas paramaecium TaxID=2898 RepID=F2HH97_9CRYP|nr:26S proteasome IOTA SU [Cryptomonas paramecium]AEA38693.1 26S proteasome IOTA SU [Cryptomonas paramecium]|mmetsp:Transcript_4383/g.12919  ORF Transcript_4383/g.12919 Transcript_4383/m.12919 type:complete len:241 (-) Transcript_4383:5359-6081(-)